MHEIARTIRFCVNLHGDPAADAAQPRVNTYANWPSMRGLGAFYELIVRCFGEPDAVTGYLVNIKVIDDAVRRHAIPIISDAVRHEANRGAGPVVARVTACLRDVFEASGDARLASVRWMLTPYHGVEMNAHTTDRVELTQQFEFAAAHRLDVPSLSDDENRAIFGKCNNPNGHGHNYRIEVAVSVPLDDDSVAALGIGRIEQLVHEHVVERFDHRHLNLDTPEFASLNPSVEHIARVCYDLLRDPMEQAGGHLARVRVWETEKTACTYPARA